MRTSLILVALCILFMASSSRAAEGDARQPYHTAQSTPEKALDAIIHRSEHGSLAADVLIPTDSTKTHRDLFTDPLLKAFANVEARMVQEDCGGHYRDDEICGLDTNPVSCAQDSDDRPYLYRTLKEDRQSVVIAYHWQSENEHSSGPIYRLVKTSDGWKLDGIRCDARLEFNMD